MRYHPNIHDDFEYAEKLSAEEWMIDVLKKNPDYNGWGNHEDYMIKDSGWDSRAFINSVDELWFLDDLNELVNFYFQVVRKSKDCNSCEQTGYNQETKKIADTWYDFKGLGVKWYDNITQDEADALWNEGRLQGDFKEKPTAEEVNNWAKKQ